MNISIEASTAHDMRDEVCGMLAVRARSFRKRLYSGKREQEQNEIIARVLENLRDDLLTAEIVKLSRS